MSALHTYLDYPNGSDEQNTGSEKVEQSVNGSPHPVEETVTHKMGKVYKCYCKQLNKQFKEKIPRPRNAFILFRQHKSKQSKTKNIMHLSKEIAQEWNTLSVEDKAYWQQQAEEERRTHREKYPGYVYFKTTNANSQHATKVCNFCLANENLFKRDAAKIKSRVQKSQTTMVDYTKPQLSDFGANREFNQQQIADQWRSGLHMVSAPGLCTPPEQVRMPSKPYPMAGLLNHPNPSLQMKYAETSIPSISQPSSAMDIKGLVSMPPLRSEVPGMISLPPRPVELSSAGVPQFPGRQIVNPFPTPLTWMERPSWAQTSSVSAESQAQASNGEYFPRLNEPNWSQPAALGPHVYEPYNPSVRSYTPQLDTSRPVYPQLLPEHGQSHPIQSTAYGAHPAVSNSGYLNANQQGYFFSK